MAQTKGNRNAHIRARDDLSTLIANAAIAVADTILRTFKMAGLSIRPASDAGGQWRRH
jgi:hypothetical protein